MTGKIKLSSPQQTLYGGVDWDSAASQCPLSELRALIPRWGEEQDLPLGSLFRSAWKATQLALKFSILTSYPGLPPAAGNGSAERRRERNGNASTAGRAARPPPATVSVPPLALPLYSECAPGHSPPSTASVPLATLPPLDGECALGRPSPL